jgi:hypothetical protein
LHVKIFQIDENWVWWPGKIFSDLIEIDHFSPIVVFVRLALVLESDRQAE